MITAERHWNAQSKRLGRVLWNLGECDKWMMLWGKSGEKKDGSKEDRQVRTRDEYLRTWGFTVACSRKNFLRLGRVGSAHWQNNPGNVANVAHLHPETRVSRLYFRLRLQPPVIEFSHSVVVWHACSLFREWESFFCFVSAFFLLQ